MLRVRQSGFILVLVLSMLVILSILAGTIAAVAQRLRDQEETRKRIEDSQVDFESTRATMLYLLLTQRMTAAGVTVDDRVVLTEDEQQMRQRDEEVVSLMPVGNEIALDNRAYAGLGGVAFSLQDDRGLVSVNWVGPVVIERWLATFQRHDQPVPAATLQNLLLDYQDDDDLHRLNSAERRQYAQENRRPPSNLPLATPLELRAVKGWGELLTVLDDAELLGQVGVGRSPTINVNTAPEAVLQALPGIDASIARRIVDARALSPFMTPSAFFAFAGLPVTDENHVTIYPSDSGVMRLWLPGTGIVRSIHWSLTPWDDGGRPWREDYELNLPQDDSTNPPSLARPASTLFARALP